MHACSHGYMSVVFGIKVVSRVGPMRNYKLPPFANYVHDSLGLATASASWLAGWHIAPSYTAMSVKIH